MRFGLHNEDGDDALTLTTITQTIFISSWEPEALQLGVSKRPDKRHLSLLDSAEGGEGADSGDSYFSWSGAFFLPKETQRAKTRGVLCCRQP